jgi:hypothetical protein
MVIVRNVFGRFSSYLPTSKNTYLQKLTCNTFVYSDADFLTLPSFDVMINLHPLAGISFCTKHALNRRRSKQNMWHDFQYKAKNMRLMKRKGSQHKRIVKPTMSRLLQ